MDISNNGKNRGDRQDVRTSLNQIEVRIAFLQGQKQTPEIIKKIEELQIEAQRLQRQSGV